MTISEAISQALQGKRVRNHDWDNNAYCYAKVGAKATTIIFKPEKGKLSKYSAESADLISKNWEMIGDHK